MKLTTTFWSEKVHEFDKILYINGKSQEIIFQTDLNDVRQTQLFFKKISKFANSKVVHETIDSDWNNGDYYQFAVLLDNEVMPVKWFELHINESLIISHDIAFDTTLIKKNDIEIPFGNFPMYYYRRNANVKLPKYRQFNIEYRAYKYISNQLKKYCHE